VFGDLGENAAEVVVGGLLLLCGRLGVRGRSHPSPLPEGEGVGIGDEALHAVQARFIERFEDVQGREEERARAAGRVQHGDGRDGVVEGA
jgi:hypothetical protein